MDENLYNIVGKFESFGNTMLVVRIDGAACVVTEEEYSKIINAELKYSRYIVDKIA